METTGALPRRGALVLVKAVHTAIWFTVELAVGYLIYSGFTKRTDRSVTVAAFVVASESAVFMGCGAACPLTEVAESLGAGSGSVTDIYLPRPVARNLPLIHIPLVGLILYLHRERILGWLRRTPVRSPE